MSTANQPFIHQPRPASVATEPRHSWLRRFGRTGTPHALRFIACTTDRDSRAILSMLRDGKKDVADLEVSLGVGTGMTATIRMTPTEMRELAACLMDAAADIELLPAAELTALANAFAGNAVQGEAA